MLLNGCSECNECEGRDGRRQKLFAEIVSSSRLQEPDTDGKQSTLLQKCIWLMWYRITCQSRKVILNSYKNVIEKKPILATGLQFIS